MAAAGRMERVRRALGDERFAFVKTLSKKTDIGMEGVLRTLKVHGGDLRPSFVELKLREFGGLSGGIKTKMPVEAASYPMRIGELHDLESNVAVLRFIHNKPLNDDEMQLAQDIHRLLWKHSL